MLTILNYFRVRYMSEKAQGIVEYALVIAFVVAIGAVLVKTGDGFFNCRYSENLHESFDDRW